MDANKPVKRRRRCHRLTPKRKPKKNKPAPLVFPNYETFRSNCVYPQQFPFRSTIMQYVFETASPEVWQKLYKCSKYFFIKHPVIIVNSIFHDERGWSCCKPHNCNGLYECNYRRKRDKIFDLNEEIDKIWLVQRLCIANGDSKCISTLIPKIYRCDIYHLQMIGQVLTYEELKFLTSGIDHCALSSTTITYDGEEQVPAENIAKLFAGANSFLISNSLSLFCKNYSDLVAACGTMKKVGYQFPATFDVAKFYRCLKSSKNLARIYIYFFSGETRLEEIVDEILMTTSSDYIPPIIKFPGQDSTKLEKMEELQKTATERLCNGTWWFRK